MLWFWIRIKKTKAPSCSSAPRIREVSAGMMANSALFGSWRKNQRHDRSQVMRNGGMCFRQYFQNKTDASDCKTRGHSISEKRNLPLQSLIFNFHLVFVSYILIYLMSLQCLVSDDKSLHYKSYILKGSVACFRFLSPLLL